MKRFLAFIVCVLLLIGAGVGAFSVSAETKISVADRFNILMGDFGSPGVDSSRFPQNASYAWLEEVFIREAESSLVYNELVPIDEYPFTDTIVSFKEDVATMLKLIGQAKDPVSMVNSFASIYEQVKLGLSLVGTGITDYEKQAYLEEKYGIIFPDEGMGSAYDEMMTTVLYAVDRYELAKTIFGSTELTIPIGTALEEATVVMLKGFLKNSELKDANKGSLANVTTMNGLALELMKAYLASQDVVLADNATDQEIISALILTLARQIGYDNAPSPGETMVQEQLDVYELASEIFMRYQIMCEPGELLDAMKAEDSDNAIARVILETMVKEKSAMDTSAMSDEDLFTQTLILGYFALGAKSVFASSENASTNRDFYSDVYEYNVPLQYIRERVFLSAYSFAPLMDPVGLSENVTLKINGTEAKLSRSITITLDPEVKEQMVDLEVHYVDKDKGVDQTQHYVFHIIQGSEKAPTDENSMIDSVVGIATAIGSVNQVEAKPYTTTAPTETTLAADYVPSAPNEYVGTLPDLQINEPAAVLGVYTAVSVNTNSGGYSAQGAASGIDAIIERLKQDNLWIYVAVGLVLLAVAVTVFVCDQRRQEAEHLAMGFKPKGKGSKSGAAKKPKADNRF
ncbi:MAG: hypothetical protein LBQ80_03410 [Clostridium sp.]|nr:hypothetical protein [Clostridium sp.]